MNGEHGIEIKVSDIGDFEEVEVIEILVNVGDIISMEDSLITVESDKASMEIPTPLGGVVKEVIVTIGDKVSEGTPILTIGSLNYNEINDKYISLVQELGGVKNKLQNQQSEVKKLYKNFQKSIEEMTDLFSSFIKDHEKMIDSLSVDYKNEIKNKKIKIKKEIRETINSTLSDYNKYMLDKREKINEKIKLYKIDIEKKSKDFESALLTKLKTESAVTFWKEKTISHKKNERLILFLISIFSFLSITFLIIIINIFYNNDISLNNIKLWAVVSMGGFSFFSIWIGRFLVRLYLTQNALKEDSSEKLVIAKTYISLVKDGLVTDSQVDIMLQALFRPNDTSVNFKNDVSPTLPQETLLKSLKSNISNNA